MKIREDETVSKSNKSDVQCVERLGHILRQRRSSSADWSFYISHINTCWHDLSLGYFHALCHDGNLSYIFDLEHIIRFLNVYVVEIHVKNFIFVHSDKYLNLRETLIYKKIYAWFDIVWAMDFLSENRNFILSELIVPICLMSLVSGKYKIFILIQW